MNYKFLNFCKDILKESTSTFWVLFKIMLPVSIVVKMMQEFDLIVHIGNALSPFMKILGLPGEMGLVWATGMIANLFGGIIAFMNISSDVSLTIEQVTIVSILLLVAHTFPIELQIARKSGCKLFPMFLLRFGMAILLGFSLHIFYSSFGMLQEKAPLLLTERVVQDTGIFAWLLNELKNYFVIFCFITALLIVIKILKVTGGIHLITKVLSPLLKFLGIGVGVMTITIVGLTLGIVYGGALIIAEAKSGSISRKDIFYSLAFMGICHSLIEDSILMISLGGHYTGVIFGRIIFTILVMFLIVKFTKKLSEKQFEYLFLKKKYNYGMQSEKQ